MSLGMLKFDSFCGNFVRFIVGFSFVILLMIMFVGNEYSNFSTYAEETQTKKSSIDLEIETTIVDPVFPSDEKYLRFSSYEKFDEYVYQLNRELGSTGVSHNEIINKVNQQKMRLDFGWKCYVGKSYWCYESIQKFIVVNPDSSRDFIKMSAISKLTEEDIKNFKSKSIPAIKSEIYEKENDIPKLRDSIASSDKKESVKIETMMDYFQKFNIPPPPNQNNSIVDEISNSPPYQKENIVKPTIKKVEPRPWWCFWCR